MNEEYMFWVFLPKSRGDFLIDTPPSLTLPADRKQTGHSYYTLFLICLDLPLILIVLAWMIKITRTISIRAGGV